MFFGLQVKSTQNQAKPFTIPNTLKLSQAVLEPTKNGKKEPVALVAEYDKKQFILCVLDPSLSWQSPLDLVFEGGSEVKFFLRGTGTIHLTGYESYDDLDDMSMSMSSDDDIEISDSDDEPVKKKMVKNSPPKTSPKSKTNGLKGPSKNKDGQEDVDDNDDDDDSDDDDFDFGDNDADEEDDVDENDDDDDEDEEMSDEDDDSDQD